jgi:CMP-N,N'-diacetyllegionaminic acid synthase
MTLNKKIMALIPARGGSKGLPGKNIKEICGLPLIAHSINAAKGSKYINKIVISTDSEEIANVGLDHGAEVPFMRPSELASDTALAPDAYIYTLKKLKDDFNYVPDLLIVLLPTSPLRDSKDIDLCIEKYFSENADSVISVVEYEHPIERARVLNEKGLMRNYLDSEVVLKNRQEYKKVFAPNGSIYVLNPNLLIEKKTYYFSKTFPYIMDREKSVDIDTLFDFQIAEFIMKKNNQK